MSPADSRDAPKPSASLPRHIRVARFFEAHPWFFDVLFKAGPLMLLAVLLYPLGQQDTGLFGVPAYWPARFLLELTAILPLAFSRVRPGLAAGIMALSCLGQVLSGAGPGVSAVAVPLVVYACAKYGTQRVSRFYLGVALVGALVLAAFVFVMSFVNVPAMYRETGQVFGAATLLGGFAGAIVLVAWLFGHTAGRRQREVETISERNRLLERERDQEARLAADAERMRIAREMHDVVSHSMSVMIAQADGGRYIVRQDPERAAQAFETIGGTGREALTELRRMLGVLREESEQIDKRPAPGLRDLPALIEDVRASGLQVQLRTAQDTLPPVEDGVGLAAYRIVQEALTNTLKHGGQDATATVWLGVAPAEESSQAGHELMVEIGDTGAGSSAHTDGAGSGLRGMHERAVLYGGEVKTSAHQDGFHVLARFPVRSSAPRAEAPAQESGSPTAPAAETTHERTHDHH